MGGRYKREVPYPHLSNNFGQLFLLILKIISLFKVAFLLIKYEDICIVKVNKHAQE